MHLYSLLTVVFSIILSFELKVVFGNRPKEDSWV